MYVTLRRGLLEAEKRVGIIRSLNLDIHNFSLNYPWVMTPLSDTLG
jgi:hypothetical protein